MNSIGTLFGAFRHALERYLGPKSLNLYNNVLVFYIMKTERERGGRGGEGERNCEGIETERKRGSEEHCKWLKKCP